MRKFNFLFSVLLAVGLLFSTNTWAGNVAKIGSTEYTTLAAAIAAVKDGETITIIDDINVTGWVTINKPAVAFTIDLNGKTIKRTNGSIFDIYSKVTFKDSQTDGTIKAHGRALYGNEGADFTLESGNIIGTDGNVINVIGDYGSAKKPAKFTMNGGAVIGAEGVNVQGNIYGAEFVMNGGTITSEKAGLVWHGNNTEDAVKITINAGTITGKGEGALNGNGSKSGAKVTIVDGTFTCDGGSAMYMPYQGNTTISGGTFTGTEALAIKGGNVSISGGTFIANGEAIDPTSAGESAYAKTGDAIYVEDNYYVSDYTWKHSTVLTITGGVFTSTNANALSARFANDGKTAAKVAAQITISGGQFKSATNKAVIHTSNGFAGSIVASAGVYNLAPAQDYIVEGKSAVANTDEETKTDYPWMIGEATPVAQIGTTKYPTLAAAIAAVPTTGVETTIQMIANETIDVAKAPLTIAATQNIVLDLNGYMVQGNCTTGTTSAMITNKGTLTIQDATDTKKNGTGTGKLIAGADPTWTWDGSSSYQGSYASNLIRNDGTLTIESGYLGNVSKGSAAFGIDSYSNTEVSVTINGGKINAECCAIRMWVASKSNSLTISNGILEGAYLIYVQQPSATLSGDATVSITGGEFTAKKTSYRTYDLYPICFDYLNAGKIDFTISGGKFKRGNANSAGNPIKYVLIDGTYSENKTIVFEGGVYNYSPDADYIVEGKSAVANTDEETKTDYPWMIGVEPVKPLEEVTIDKDVTYTDKDGNTSSVENVATIVSNVVTNNDGTSITQSETGDWKVKTAKPEAGEAQDYSGSSTMVDTKSITVVLTSAVVETNVTISETQYNTVVTSMTFDVTPKVKVITQKTGEAACTTQVEVKTFAEPITFRLPVDKSYAGKYMKVWHQATDAADKTKWDLVGGYLVETTGEGDAMKGYIELAAKEFSFYKVEGNLWQYERTLDGYTIGTICLPRKSCSTSGAKFYRVADKKMNGSEISSIDLEEVQEDLAAGRPYVFIATSGSTKVVVCSEQEEDAVESPEASSANNGLAGTFSELTLSAFSSENQALIFYNDQLYTSVDGDKIPVNCAYILADQIKSTKQNAPRIRLYNMDAQGTTAVDNVVVVEEDAVIYDMLGHRLQEISAPGLYIVNGQKVFIKK